MGNALKVVLADSFTFMLKSWGFHWNVEGPDFAQYHAFLGDLYTEVQGAIDPIAEHIRTLDEYSPADFDRYKELSNIRTTTSIPEARSMLSTLLEDNEKLIKSISDGIKEAGIDPAHKGIENFLQDRLDIHQKHGWMLRSLTKK